MADTEPDAGRPGDGDAGGVGGGGGSGGTDAAPATGGLELSGDAEPVFVDVAAEAGLDHVQAAPATTTGCGNLSEVDCIYSEIHMTGGAAAGDYDGDGWTDIYVTRLEEPGVLYRNRGDGTFEDVTAQMGLDAAPAGGNGTAFGDVDGDGDLDLYVTSVTERRFHLFIQTGDRFVEEAVERGVAVESSFRHSGFSVGFGDFDRDGYLDLHTTEWLKQPPIGDAPSHARFFHNRGRDEPGHFRDVTVEIGVDMLAGLRANRNSFSTTFTDLDGDGWQELAVVCDFRRSRLFWNEMRQGYVDGTLFSEVGTDLNGMGSAFGDYDNDGDLDWFISSIFDPDYSCDNISCGWGTNGNRLYRNEGGRKFTDVTDEAGVRDGGWGWGTSFLDYDNDGDLDLVQTNGVDFPNAEADLFSDDATRLWRNRGDGSFETMGPEVLDDRGDGKGLLVLDYDEDGDLDIFVAQHEGRPSLFRNDGGNDAAWLRVSLLDDGPNRFGIGARVTVRRRPGDPEQVREIRASGQFLGQNEAVAHFGLGAYDGPVHSVHVWWPDGRTTELRDVDPRQHITVEP